MLIKVAEIIEKYVAEHKEDYERWKNRKKQQKDR